MRNFALSDRKNWGYRLSRFRRFAIYPAHSHFLGLSNIVEGVTTRLHRSTPVPFKFPRGLPILGGYGQPLLLPAPHSEPRHVACCTQSRRLPASRIAWRHHLPRRGIPHFCEEPPAGARFCGTEGGRRGSEHAVAFWLLPRRCRLDATEQRAAHLGPLAHLLACFPLDDSASPMRVNCHPLTAHPPGISLPLACCPGSSRLS